MLALSFKRIHKLTSRRQSRSTEATLLYCLRRMAKNKRATTFRKVSQRKSEVKLWLDEKTLGIQKLTTKLTIVCY